MFSKPEPETKTEDSKPTDKELIKTITRLIKSSQSENFVNCLQIIVADEQSDLLTVYAKQDARGAASKYKLRDDYFKNILGLSVQNVPEAYHFHISKDEALKNKIIMTELQNYREKMQKRKLTDEKIKNLTSEGRNLLLAIIFLSIIIPLPGHLEWTMVDGKIRAWLPNNEGEFDIEAALQNQTLVSSFNYLEDINPLIAKVKASIRRGHAKWCFTDYIQIDDISMLIPFFEKINGMGESMLQSYYLDEFNLLYISPGIESMVKFIDNYIGNCEHIKNQVSAAILASSDAFEPRSNLTLILDYLFFSPEQTKKPKSKNTTLLPSDNPQTPPTNVAFPTPNKNVWGNGLQGTALDGYFKNRR